MEEVRVPQGLRWSCGACGKCCERFDLGPVEPETIERLEQANIADRWQPAANADWYSLRTMPDGSKAAFLNRTGVGCIFLRPDRLCAVHDLLGEDAKPGFCREFPFQVVHDPSGANVTVREACATFAEHYGQGEPVSEPRVQEVLALPRVVPRQRFAPPHVVIDGAKAVSLEGWMILESELLALLGTTPWTPDAGVAAVRDHLAARCKLDTVPPRAEQQTAAVDAVVAALHTVISRMPPAPEPYQAAFVERASNLLAGAASHRVPPPLDSATQAWIGVVLRSTLMAKRFAAWGSVSLGFGGVLMGLHIAGRAATAHPPDRRRAALGEGFGAWTHLTAIPMVRQLIRRAEPAVRDMWLHAHG
jgi:Fe-S-cluster containining protein